MILLKNIILTLCIFLFTFLCKASEDIFNDWTPLYEGIEYRLTQRMRPNALRIHQMRIDMNNPNVRFIVTPPEEGTYQVKSMKTTSFLDKYGVKIAINGTGYFPFKNEPEGALKSMEAFAVSEGKQYGWTKMEDGAFVILKNREAKIIRSKELDKYKDEIIHGLGGWNMDGSSLLVVQGEINEELNDGQRLARTAVGLSEDGSILYLVVVACGPRHNFWYKDWISVGATMKDLSIIMQNLGCYNALNLDSSGATTMAISDLNNKALLINVPSDYRASVERSVGNHLGVYTKRLNKDYSTKVYGILKEAFTEHYSFIMKVKNTGAGLAFYEGETKDQSSTTFLNLKKYCEANSPKEKFLYLSNLQPFGQKAIGALKGSAYRDENEVVWFVNESKEIINEYLGSKLMNLFIGPRAAEVKLFKDTSKHTASKHIIKFVQEPEVLEIKSPIVGEFKLDLAANLIGIRDQQNRETGYINEEQGLASTQVNFENSFKFNWDIDEENIYKETLLKHFNMINIKEMNIIIEELMAIPDYYILKTLNEGIDDIMATELGLKLDIEKYQKLGSTLIKRKQQLNLIYEDLKLLLH